MGLAGSTFGASAKALEKMVAMGNLAPEAAALSGLVEIEDARKRIDPEAERRKRTDEFMLEIERTRDFLDRLEARIAETKQIIEELKAQRIEAMRIAEEAFARAIEADELIDAIDDGVSAEERQQLIELLGPEAADASPEELIVLLKAFRDKNNQTGREQTGKAADLEERIERERDKYDRLRDERDAYFKADTPEAKAAIEDRVNEFMLSGKFEDAPDDGVNLDFEPPSPQ